MIVRKVFFFYQKPYTLLRYEKFEIFFCLLILFSTSCTSLSSESGYLPPLYSNNKVRMEEFILFYFKILSVFHSIRTGKHHVQLHIVLHSQHIDTQANVGNQSGTTYT